MKRCKHKWAKEVTPFPGNYESICTQCATTRLRLTYPNKTVLLYYTNYNYPFENEHYYKRRIHETNTM